MKKFTIYIFIMLFASTAAFAQSGTEETTENQSLTLSTEALPITKAAADSAYINEQYDTAIAIYEELLSKKGTAAEVYYNLGNAYFRVDNIAKAIINYERALLIKPNNSDYQANLAIAQAKIVDKYEAPNELFFITWGKWIVNIMQSNQWAVTSIIFFLTLLTGLGLLLIGKSGLMKRIGLIVSCVFVFLTPVTTYCAYYQKAKFQNRNAAIVVEPSIEVRSTPSESGTALFVIHQGKRVVIKDNTMSSWKEIKLENGEVGWLPTDAIEII